MPRRRLGRRLLCVPAVIFQMLNQLVATETNKETDDHDESRQQNQSLIVSALVSMASKFKVFVLLAVLAAIIWLRTVKAVGGGGGEDRRNKVEIVILNSGGNCKSNLPSNN